MEYDRINVFAARNNELVAAAVHINDEFVGATGVGGCWDVSGLTAIKVPISNLKISVLEGGEKIELKGFYPDGDPWTAETIIFNFDTMTGMAFKVPRRN